MKKIGTITYHAPYNYGGNLQAYALQQFILNNFENIEYKIINFRTKNQKILYKNAYKKKNFKNIIKQIVNLPQWKNIKKREELFENFINNYLNITKEYESLYDLQKINNDFDYYLCGSDQIWNTTLPDFDWAYFLEFTKSPNKISYATSFGTSIPNLSNLDKKRIKENLESFKNISVRESCSVNFIKELTGIEAKLNIDPTMLISKNDWEKLISNEKIVENEYVFYYDLKDLKENIKIMKKIKKHVKINVVITRYSGIYSYFTNFKKQFDTGPIEFLNLIKNAKFIVTSSFHGVVFSILLNKPFLVIDGLKDNRIKEILLKSNLDYLNINYENCLEKIDKLGKIDFNDSLKYIEQQKKQALNYLKQSIK